MSGTVEYFSRQIQNKASDSARDSLAFGGPISREYDTREERDEF